MHCDRGTNFVGAERELRESLSKLSDASIQRTLLSRGIDWSFNPPQASHFGGIWERQIRTIRKVFNATMTEQTLSDDGLLTLMCEIEAITNSRPLTTVSNDCYDLTPLMPNHLLTLQGATGVVGTFKQDDTYCKRRWRHIQYLADLFWTRWKREYLSNLQIRHKWNKEGRNLRKNDVVIIADETTPRCHWSLGRVEDVKTGSDGLVGSAIVRCGKSLVNRPISKLVLLCENNA
ncbi:hypothetical protein Pcinc_009224 [Petrolisthes cinctipes]|uniref:Integrase catalytic domain-containing protein n=1 Tax=Petrolisthes cinctipes TaxID=88211 RepID=A0AAE1G5Q8_PETCI|nr:hypothetical protein Pcinc_009224 [Petrolisthes cinctipes]